VSAPRVSVLTTVFNGMPFLEAAIQSIFAQNLADWEHVVVDDGSFDDTRRYLESWTNSRVRPVFRPRSGRGVALNVGLAQCRGEYVAILDADDTALPFRLACQVAALDAHPELAMVAGGAIYSESEASSVESHGCRTVELHTRQLIGRNPVIHSSVMIRREALCAVGGYDASRSNLFDFDLWVRLVESGGRIGLVDLPLIFRRIHPDQYFERRNRLGYLWAGFLVRRRAARLFGSSFRDHLLPYAGFVYGLLPRQIRLWQAKRLGAAVQG